MESFEWIYGYFRLQWVVNPPVLDSGRGGWLDSYFLAEVKIAELRASLIAISQKQPPPPLGGRKLKI